MRHNHSITVEAVDDHGVDLVGLEFMTANVPEAPITENHDLVMEEVDKDFIPLIPDTQLKAWVIERYNLQEAAEEIVDSKVQDLKEEKSVIRKMARDYVHCFLVEALKSKGVKNVRSMNDIKKYWKENKESEAGIATMTYVLYGYFDDRKQWENIVEQKILSILGKRYKNGESKIKGCIARILNEEKNEKVKQIQKQVKHEIKL